MQQARRSLLIWKIHGQRLDGFSNDDFAVETTPGDPDSLVYEGKPLANKPENRRLINFAYTGSIMPPPEAIVGTYVRPDGQRVKVAPVSDSERRDLARWIDLGCPIDLDYSPTTLDRRGSGWQADDQRPTLTLTDPPSSRITELRRILVGMHDYDSGIDPASFSVTADFPLDGLPAGENLAARFQPKWEGVYELRLATPIRILPQGTLTIAISDRQGNATRIERTISVGPAQ